MHFCSRAASACAVLESWQLRPMSLLQLSSFPLLLVAAPPPTITLMNAVRDSSVHMPTIGLGTGGYICVVRSTPP